MIVEKIFNEYLTGKEICSISKMLNEENVPTVKGEDWHNSTIGQILMNERYKGDAILQKYIGEDIS